VVPVTLAELEPFVAHAPIPGVLPPELDAQRAVWLRRYARQLIALDSLILLLGGLVGVLLTPGIADRPAYLVGCIALVPVWLVVLALSRCYERRFLGTGTEEFKRVSNGCFRVAAVVISVFFMTGTPVSRLFLALALSMGLVGVVGGRYGARLWLHRQRHRGQCMHRVVVVGPAAAALEMTTQLQREPLSGLSVVGACVIDNPRTFTKDSLIPVLGTLSEVVPVLARLGADTVVVAKGEGITADSLRQLAYDLEGTGVDLLVSPLLTNVAGSRISWRSVPGLPLLHVSEPELGGSRRIVKGIFDRGLGLALLLLAAPFLLGIALAVRLTSRGPAFFRQERVGRAGETFRIWKLRTMFVGAEAERASLQRYNSHGETGVLFKIREDPRITPIGRILRRYSIDELPQLLNVVAGHMSLVGPRPPLMAEVERYESTVHRRLLVKPGMTGLWQVSGRADLPWEESVRLDLHYVENWSLGLDVAVICKTVLAVLRPTGAY
jgi:exopolysaccharide biosynthesis polyprenyl glycosylphosphotransferase